MSSGKVNWTSACASGPRYVDCVHPTCLDPWVTASSRIQVWIWTSWRGRARERVWPGLASFSPAAGSAGTSSWIRWSQTWSSSASGTRFLLHRCGRASQTCCSHQMNCSNSDTPCSEWSSQQSWISCWKNRASWHAPPLFQDSPSWYAASGHLTCLRRAFRGLIVGRRLWRRGRRSDTSPALSSNTSCTVIQYWKLKRHRKASILGDGCLSFTIDANPRTVPAFLSRPHHYPWTACSWRTTGRTSLVVCSNRDYAMSEYRASQLADSDRPRSMCARSRWTMIRAEFSWWDSASIVVIIYGKMRIFKIYLQ